MVTRCCSLNEYHKTNSMELLGLNTIGRKDNFSSSVAKLRGILASLLFDLMISFENEQIFSSF